MGGLTFDEVFPGMAKKDNTPIEKFVVTIDKGDKTYTGEEQRFAMKFFDEESEVLKYVSDISNGEVVVHKIFVLNHEGQTVEKTIGFIQGQLEVIDVTRI